MANLDLKSLLNKEKKKGVKKKVTKKSTSKDDKKMAELTAGQVDVERAKLDKYRLAKKAKIFFSVPEPIKDEFLEKAIELGYFREKRGYKEADQKKFFYHCLRLAGIDIPDDEKLDNRRL